MKMFLTFLVTLLLVGCNSSREKLYFIIDDFDGTHYIFPIADNVHVELKDLNFLNQLSPGIIVTRGSFEIKNFQLVPLLKIPNSKRDTVYGNLDKYYTSYIAKFESGSFKYTSDKIDSIEFGFINRTYKLPIRNAYIDSFIVRAL